MNRILVADDEGCIRRFVEELCEAAKFAVDTVCDGEAAWILMSSMGRRYSAVFLDLDMPGWNGLDALETYQGSERHVVIMCNAIDDNFKKYLEDHPAVMLILKKPFGTREMARILQELILENA